MLEKGKARVEAAILVAAGADASRIPYWTQVGTRRAAQARQVPFGAHVLEPGG